MLMRRPHSVSAGVGRLRCRTSRLSSYVSINYPGAKLRFIGHYSAPSTGSTGGAEASGRPGDSARCAPVDGGLRTTPLAVRRRARGRQKEGRREGS